MQTVRITTDNTLVQGDPYRRGSMTLLGQTRQKTNQPNLLKTGEPMLIGTWNIRTMYEAGRSVNIAREMKKYKLKLLGLCETRWLKSGEVQLGTKETIIYSGHEHDNASHTEGVGFMLSQEARRALIGWEPINSRIIKAKFKTSNKRITLSTIMCYAPTNESAEEEKDQFYNRLQALMQERTEREVTILMGDFNAKIGQDNTGYSKIMGKHGRGTMNENGQLFADFCAENNLAIGGSLFPHKEVHKITWVSPDHVTENQIDHICISTKFRRSLLDVRSKRGADVPSDHHLVMGKVQLKLKRCHETKSPRVKYDTAKLKDQDIQQQYQITLRNKYEVLQDLDSEDENIEETWKKSKRYWLHHVKKELAE